MMRLTGFPLYPLPNIHYCISAICHIRQRYPLAILADLTVISTGKSCRRPERRYFTSIS